MNHITFQPATGEIHHCTGHREGDWLIFICPVCKEDYIRRINLVTGEMIFPKSTNKILHTGSHVPAFNNPAEIFPLTNN